MAETLKSKVLLRIASAVVLGPPVIALVWMGGWPYSALMAVAAAILVYEWASMVGKRAGWLALGLVYVALSVLALWWLRGDPELGLVTLVWLFAVVWATDIGGYVFGLTLRGPKLAPSISPNKTWSGFLGGTSSAVVAGALVAGGFDVGSPLKVGAFAGVTAVISQLGDLFESHIKRKFGVKDSSNLIPGHGGLFDRVDGLVASALWVAAFSLVVGEGALAWL